MGVTTYYSVGGEILGERQGAVRRDYLRDALGSVTATKVTGDATLQNTYRYKPYGERLAKTGAAPDPKFQHVGTAGYRHTPISHSTSYVRHRHLANEEGRWTTVDPLWPSQPSYDYSSQNPCTKTDPTGRLPSIQGCNKCFVTQQNGTTEPFEVAVRGTMERLCGNKTASKTCIARCNVMAKVNVDPRCVLNDFCVKGTIKCVSGSCKGPGSPAPCPRGCGCTESQVTMPDCGSTDCKKSMPRPFEICCDANVDTLYKLCKCSSRATEFIPTVSCTKDGIRSIGLTALHELVHSCTPDCTPDYLNPKKGDDWAKCMLQCLFSPF